MATFEFTELGNTLLFESANLSIVQLYRLGNWGVDEAIISYAISFRKSVEGRVEMEKILLRLIILMTST